MKIMRMQGLFAGGALRSTVSLIDVVQTLNSNLAFLSLPTNNCLTCLVYRCAGVRSDNAQHSGILQHYIT